MFADTVKHLGPEEQEQLTIEAMSLEALTTSEIEERSWIGRASSRRFADN